MDMMDIKTADFNNSKETLGKNAGTMANIEVPLYAGQRSLGMLGIAS